MIESEMQELQKLIRRWKRKASNSLKWSRNQDVSYAGRERFFGEGNEVRTCANELRKLLESFGGDK